MCDSRASMAVAGMFLVVLVQSMAVLVSAQGSGTKSPWQTLQGAKPLVIARGGFSGLFPDSSFAAYSLVQMTSLSDTAYWCDVQLTKDGAGICLPKITLENSTTIADVFPNKAKKYNLNGASTTGWFSIDYTLKDLANVIVTQVFGYRSSKFDGNLFPVLTVEDLEAQVKPPSIWLNIQHDAFYTQNKLSMRNYVLSITRSIVINYISSPEVGFLRSIQARVSPKVTKLVFRFLGPTEIDPSTNQTYGSLLKNLTFIKTFASGIIVPKHYIWPVSEKSYLEPHTTLVSDAHKAGLQVYAADFVNDFPLPYNYSYDPVAEYLNFIDNGEFSVDGVLSDFPISPSAAIDCFAHLSKNATKQVKTLVISKCGSSGDYPGCTNKAYTKAIEDGVDVLDCPVQISSDGIPFCMSTINLIDSTNAAQSQYSDSMTTVPEINKGTGIYAFNLTWAQIKDLKPIMSSPYAGYTLYRNPLNINAGEFLTLAEFLNLTKTAPSLSGILISIEYAAYLAEKQGLGVIDAVLTALSDAGLDNQTALRVMIQSTNSSVLTKVKEKSKYELVYQIEEDISGLGDATLTDIAGFANAVVIDKASIFPDTSLYLTGTTSVVEKIKSKKLPIYVQTFSNEFVSQAWDFFSDSTVEINSYVSGAGIDGIITDFPKTADRYRRNICLGSSTLAPYMSPVQPGSLMQIIPSQDLPPAEAPNPILTAADVEESPIPPVSAKSPPSNTSIAEGPKPSSQPKIASCYSVLSLATLVAGFVMF